MSHGRHAAPSRALITKDRVLATGTLVAAGAGVAGVGLADAGEAAAATTHDWSGVAACESSGNWHINTGNSFYGGLQFTQPTWAGYGGLNYAPRADLATPAQQVDTAEKVLTGQGIHAWPKCGKFLKDGITPATGGTVVINPQPGQHAAPPPPPPVVQPNAPVVITVARGDCLSALARAHGVTTAALYNANRDVVGGNENLIFPGQQLRLPGSATVPLASGAAPVAATRDVAPAAHAVGMTDPVPGSHIGQAFKGAAHEGVDLDAALGTPEYAPVDATVLYAGSASGFGDWIVLTAHVDGEQVDFVYGHEYPSGLLVHAGQPVRAGDMVGRVGANGNATGPHCHLEVWIGGRMHGHAVDPAGWFHSHGINL